MMSPRRHITDAVVIGAATGLFGAGFGVLAVTAGLTLGQTMAMSLLVFTGASQYTAVGVVSSGGSEATALGSALLLAARNGFYGLALAAHLRHRLLTRLVGAQLIIDESTALGLAQSDDETKRSAFWAAGLSVFVFWNIGTLLGALGGEAVGDPATLGLDAAFPAGFVALMIPSLRQRAGLGAAAAGGLVALAAVPLVEPGLPILLAGFGALVGVHLSTEDRDGGKHEESADGDDSEAEPS